MFIFALTCSCASLFAKKTTAELNYILDTNPYNRMRLDYNTDLTPSDSVKHKFLTALSGCLSPHLQDSLLRLSSWQETSFLKQSKRDCKGDSICIEATYQRITSEALANINNFYETAKISEALVLSAGSWNVREAIPILDNALDNDRYEQLSVKMALARLGNDSFMQELEDKYTLTNYLEETDFSITDDNAFEFVL